MTITQIPTAHDRLLNAKEAAQELGVNRTTFHYLIDLGLPSTRQPLEKPRKLGPVTVRSERVWCLSSLRAFKEKHGDAASLDALKSEALARVKAQGAVALKERRFDHTLDSHPDPAPGSDTCH